MFYQTTQIILWCIYLTFTHYINCYNHSFNLIYSEVYSISPSSTQDTNNINTKHWHRHLRITLHRHRKVSGNISHFCIFNERKKFLELMFLFKPTNGSVNHSRDPTRYRAHPICLHFPYCLPGQTSRPSTCRHLSGKLVCFVQTMRDTICPINCSFSRRSKPTLKFVLQDICAPPPFCSQTSRSRQQEMRHFSGKNLEKNFAQGKQFWNWSNISISYDK